MQGKLDAAGLRYRVVNAGVSGETSAGARGRIQWLLRQPVAVLVLETGANDGLRGQDPEATRANIQAILDAARGQAPPPRLVLAAMEALPNYGEAYRRRFRAIYPELARANGATLLPFLLEGVAGEAALNQPDGVHPTAEGHARIAETVWKALRPILSLRAARRGQGTANRCASLVQSGDAAIAAGTCSGSATTRHIAWCRSSMKRSETARDRSSTTGSK